MVKVKCPGCDYEWDTKAILKRVTCPNCGVKVKVNQNEEETKETNGATGGIESD